MPSPRFENEEEVWARFSAGFDRVSSSKGLMGRKAFDEAVLSSHMPIELVDRLFESFSGKSRPKTEYHIVRGRIMKSVKRVEPKPLSKESFLCGMAVVLKGTEEEKLRLLFDIIDTDSSKSISSKELYDIICIFENTELANEINKVGGRSKLAYKIHSEAVNENNASDEKMRRGEDEEADEKDLTFEQFKIWAKNKMRPGLVKWLFNMASCSASANTNSNPEQNGETGLISHLQLVSGVTEDSKKSIWAKWQPISIAEAIHFDKQEVGDLEGYYNRLLTDSVGKGVSRSAMQSVFKDIDEKLFSAIFAVFDSNKDGVISVLTVSKSMQTILKFFFFFFLCVALEQTFVIDL